MIDKFNSDLPWEDRNRICNGPWNYLIQGKRGRTHNGDSDFQAIVLKRSRSYTRPYNQLVYTRRCTWLHSLGYFSYHQYKPNAICFLPPYIPLHSLILTYLPTPTVMNSYRGADNSARIAFHVFIGLSALTERHCKVGIGEGAWLPMYFRAMLDLALNGHVNIPPWSKIDLWWLVSGRQFCVDYRKLNALTRKDRYLLPLIDENL